MTKTTFLDQAIELHEGHMDGSEPTSPESQRELMALMVRHKSEEMEANDNSTYLDQAIALHQLHLDDPTSATPESQQEMMDLMRRHRQEMSGSMREMMVKAGRRLSGATREALQAAIAALTALLDAANESEQTRAQAALEKLFGDDNALMGEMMAEPQNSIAILQAREALAVKRSDAMIALFVPQGVAQQIAWPPDETGLLYQELPANELHITLAYLDEFVTEYTKREAVAEALKKFVARFPPFVGRLSGGGVFTEVAGSGVRPVYANVDAPNLPQLREELMEALRQAGAWPSVEHGFTPHITLAYMSESADTLIPDVPSLEMRFDKLCLVWRNDRFDFELTGDSWAWKAGEDSSSKTQDSSDVAGGTSQVASLPVSSGSTTAATITGTQTVSTPLILGDIKSTSNGVVVEAGERAKAIFDIEAPCAHKALKVINASTRRVGGYATVWGEQDCDDERMLRKAIEPYVGKGAVPMMLWLHGLDKTFGSEQPGVWDGKSFRLDDIGLYVEGNVHQNAIGTKAWKRIETAGAYGFSVGSQWYLVKRAKNGDGTVDIVDWPLLEISVMEGGKQCVPSAQRRLEAGVEALYRKAALKFGIKWVDAPEEQAAPKTKVATAPKPRKRFVITGGTKMSTEAENTVEFGDAELDAMLEKKLAAHEAKKAAALKAKQDEDARIEAKAKELAEGFRAGIEKEAAEKAEKDAADKARKDRLNGRPTAPNVGVPVNDVAGIKVGSPYDRLNTIDLALRYELLRSYGKQPSEKYFRALAERAVKMAREEDTIGMKNGQPVKVSAIDWEHLSPRKLDLSEVNDDLFSAKGNMNRFYSGGGDSAEDSLSPTGLKQLHQLALKANELVYSTQANGGDEWVPTLMNAQLWRTVRLNAAVLGLFQQIDMPSQPYDYPVESTYPVFYKTGEATDESQLVLTGGPFTDSKPGTAKVTLNTGKIGAISYWSEEQEEDGIIAVEPQFRDQYGEGVAHTIDEVLISGDEATGSSNISYDGASIASTSRFLILDGLRDQALVVTAADSRSGGALTIDDFGATQALMGTAGKFGVNPNDLAFILDPAVWHKAKLLPEVLTLDKFGSMATVVTGQLGGLLGVPLIVSEDFSLTDSAGKISSTGSNNTLGSFLCVNKRGIVVGWRRRPRIRVVGLPGAEARYIVASARFDIGFREVGMAALTYNVTV